MRMTGDQIRERVQILTGDHSVGHFDEINEAYERILRDLGSWEREEVYDEGSVRFVADQSRYVLPWQRIRQLKSIWVNDVDDDADWHQVLPASDLHFEQEAAAWRDADGLDDTDRPRRFRIRDDELEVTPIPDGTYPVRLIYGGNPPELTSYTVPLLPALYHSTIARMAAVFWLMKKPNRTDADVQLARFYQQQVKDDMLPLAFDTAPNRQGRVRTPKQRLMRS